MGGQKLRLLLYQVVFGCFFFDFHGFLIFLRVSKGCFKY